jgi:hypothetical protein
MPVCGKRKADSGKDHAENCPKCAEGNLDIAEGGKKFVHNYIVSLFKFFVNELVRVLNAFLISFYKYQFGTYKNCPEKNFAIAIQICLVNLQG